MKNNFRFTNCIALALCGIPISIFTTFLTFSFVVSGSFLGFVFSVFIFTTTSYFLHTYIKEFRIKYFSLTLGSSLILFFSIWAMVLLFENKVMELLSIAGGLSVLLFSIEFGKYISKILLKRKRIE